MTVSNPPVNGKIQDFKAFECFSSTFQGKFIFQGLFKTVLYIQVLFKPVRTLLHECSCFIEFIMELRKRDKMQGLSSILSLFRNKFDGRNYITLLNLAWCYITPRCDVM